MRPGRTLLLVAVVCALTISPLRAAEAPKAGEVARLIDQLGSDVFSEREAATRALDALGPVALDALRKAAASEDAEVCRRAAAVIQRIERRQLTARVTQPKRIRLTYKDTPVTEAVADFARKTGLPLQIQGDASKLAGRKITLDTGEVSFWEAYEQFCKKASLAEPAPAAGPPANNPYAQAEQQLILRQQVVMMRKGYTASPYSQMGNLWALSDGKPADAPTFHAGALRVRALPARTWLPHESRADGQALVALEVMADPQLAWRDLVRVRIDRATDDRGQVLKQVATGGESMNLMHMGEVVVWAEDSMPMAGTPGGGTRATPVRLKLGPLAAKRLAELRGTVAAEVQGPTEPLMTIDNVLKAAGREARGPDGGLMKLLEVKQEEGGRVRLRVRVEVPPNDGLAGAIAFKRVLILNNGRGMAAGNEVALLDAKGQPLRRISGEAKHFALGQQEMDLVFQAPTGKDGPARLVYNSRRTVLIEVPFVLKNVPLDAVAR